MKNIGFSTAKLVKPCAGLSTAKLVKPHARFDEGGQARACSLLHPFPVPFFLKQEILAFSLVMRKCL
jgi:hypothetical protein